jgi:hypothetical protein
MMRNGKKIKTKCFSFLGKKLVFGIVGVSLLVLLILLGYVTNLECIGMFKYAKDADGKITKNFKTLWDWLELLIIPLVLTIGGFIFAKVQQKNEWALKILDEYHQLFETFDKFYFYIYEEKEPLLGKETNEMIALGNWVEQVALLYKKYANRRLLCDLGVETIICKFYENAQKCKFLESSLKDWKEMKTL